jgi:hypothetical protein
MLLNVPRPLSEREELEREQDELPAQLAAYQKELAATPTTFKEAGRHGGGVVDRLGTLTTVGSAGPALLSLSVGMRYHGDT